MIAVKKSAVYGLKFSVLLMMLLAACAPADLDVTPTATPTDVPSPTPTPAVAATPTPVGGGEASAAEVLESRVDAIVANVPQNMPSGAVQWRLDFTREPEVVRNVTNGIAKRVFLTEAQGGRANLTFGVFDTPEDAFNYYEFIRGLRTVLENGQTDENFPQPNLFGSGLYGSNAIFQLEDVFVEVSVEAFSSTAGNPLPPLSRNTLEVVEGAPLAAPDESDSGGEAAADNAGDGASTLDAILAAIPDILPGGAVQWRYDRSAEPQSVEATNGVARRIRISDPGGAQGTLTYGVFESAEDAAAHYEFVRGLRTVLENGQTEDNFPQPNLFGSGLYGSNAIFQMDNVFVEVSVEQFPSTAGNPLPGLSRQALDVVEEGLALVGTSADDEAGAEEVTFSLDAIVAELPETVQAGGIEWERLPESLDNAPNGSAVVVPFEGAGRVRVFLAMFNDEAAASAYSPRLSADSRSTRTMLPVGEAVITVIVDSGEAETAAPGLMSAVLSALDIAVSG